MSELLCFKTNSQKTRRHFHYDGYRHNLNKTQKHPPAMAAERSQYFFEIFAYRSEEFLKWVRKKYINKKLHKKTLRNVYGWSKIFKNLVSIL
jgi:hypothetical protein